MKKVICFSRVSGYHQDLTAQRKEVREAALKDKYKADEILEVSGKESAIKLKEEQRQTLNEMKELVEKNPTIETIYFYSVDRLARRMSVVLSIVEWAEENSINLVFLNPYLMSTMIIKDGKRKKNPMTEMILTMMGLAASMEMQVKAERFATAKEWLKSEGYATGAIPFGYTKIEDDKGKKIDVDKGEAKIINWVFDSYIDNGMSAIQIYEEGVARGYWDGKISNNVDKSNKITRMLKNKLYAGYPTKKGITYPIIIDEDRIEEAKQVMKQRCCKGNEKHSTKNIYYCKGKIFDSTNHAMVCDFARMNYCDRLRTLRLNINVAEFLCWRVAFFAKWNALTTNNIELEIKNTKKLLDETSIKVMVAKERITNEIRPKYDNLNDLYIDKKISRNKYDEKYEAIEKEEKQIQMNINEMEKKEAELMNLLEKLRTKERRNIDIYEIRDINDDVMRKEIIDEVIEKIEVRKENDNSYIITIHYQGFTSPSVFRYIAHGGTKKEIYELVGDEITLDITEEFTPRFKSNKNRKRVAK